MPTKLTIELMNKGAKAVYFDIDMVTWRSGEPLLADGFDTRVNYKEAYEEDQEVYVNSFIINTMNELSCLGIELNILTAALYEKEGVLQALKEAGLQGTISSFANASTLLEDFLDRNNLRKDEFGYILEADTGKSVSEEEQDLLDEPITNIDSHRYTNKSQYRPLQKNPDAYLVDDEARHGFVRMIYFDEQYSKSIVADKTNTREDGTIPYTEVNLDVGEEILNLTF